MKKLYSLIAGLAIVTSASAQIVISQVYGGGGNNGAPYKNDFVELFNPTTSAVTLNGAFLQYASAAGTFNLKHSIPSITIPAGGYYLVKESGGTVGADLPAADYTPASTGSDGWLTMSATAGKIVLTSDNTTPSVGGANVIDYIAFGTTATPFQGSGATPAPSNTTAILRKNGGCTNDKDNKTDFEAIAPAPRNSATAKNVCSSLATSNIKISRNLVKNTIVSNTITFGASSDITIYDVSGKIIKSASVSDGKSLDISALPKGTYVVTGSINGTKTSQKIIKQ